MKASVNSSLRGKRVLVGLSGGVDSAVTAALLKEAGADVTGVFIKGWYPPGMPCSWADDRRDAMRVAAHLGLRFETLDASEQYRTGVIEYLLREYQAGRTPNPDVMCNREVKFGAFWKYALEQGADHIATGHYARLEEGKLSRGLDPEKDQSYFLWAVPKEALAQTLFPLGGMQKGEVRKLARKLKLPNAAKRDSQGICFLGNVSVEDFLVSEFGTKPGDALDSSGTRIGAHQGALLATIGQRVALADAAPGPWYVIGKDVAANTLTVAHEKQAGTHTAFRLESTNWLREPVPGHAYAAQYRYHGPRIEGTADAHTFIPTMPVPEPVASGQSLVLYDAEECIGGGIIG